jgi:hypothetical protein
MMRWANYINFINSDLHRERERERERENACMHARVRVWVRVKHFYTQIKVFVIPEARILLSVCKLSFIRYGTFLCFSKMYHSLPCSDQHLLAENYWVPGHCPSSGILNTRKHNFLETGSVSVLRWREWFVQWLRLAFFKGLNGVGVSISSPENGDVVVISSI